MSDPHSNSGPPADPIDALPNSTPTARTVGRPWPKGVSGNPAGRAKGARHKLQDGFLTALQKRWEESGEEVLRRCAEEEPATFVKIVASLIPKDVTISARPLAELTDDELLHAIEIMRRYLDAGAPAIATMLTTIEGQVVVSAATDERH